MRILFLFFLIAIGLQGKAYIPSSRMILERVAENAIRLPLYVEQDVTINSGGQSVTVKEHWLFESENSARLVVYGEKDLKDQISFQNLYSDSSKTSSLTGMLQTQKAYKDLPEKIFFLKGTESLMSYLIRQGVVGDEIFKSQSFKKLPGTGGFQYHPESFLRLGRLGGVVSYIFGPTPRGEAQTPGLWVEQDQFNLLKMRNSQGNEIRAEKPSVFARGIRWPKEIDYNYVSSENSLHAVAEVVNAHGVEASQRQIFQKVIEKRTSEFEKHTGRSLVEEFYSRFR